MNLRIVLMAAAVSIGIQSVPCTHASPLEWVGRYANPAYNGEYDYQENWVELTSTSDGRIQIEMNLPCGTKLSPMLLTSESMNITSGRLQVVERGSSQCYVGENPRYLILDGTLQIITGPNIRVPGFDGTYTFSKVVDQ